MRGKDGGDQQQRGIALMRDGDVDLHAAHQCGDAEYDLQRHEQHDPQPRLRAAARRTDREPDKRGGGGERPPAVEELDDDGIVDRIAPRGIDHGHARGEQRVAHQRPAGEGIAGIEAGGERAIDELDDQRRQREHRGARQSRGRGRGIAVQRHQVERGPDDAGEDGQRGEQMDGEADMADVGTDRQARGDHPPADSPLETTERQQRAEAPAIACRNLAPHREPQQRQREGHADQPAPQTVQIFPEEDVLEPGERHITVERLIFRDAFVIVEFGLPLRLVQRRDGAADRFPLRDGQAGFGQAGDAADHDHRDDQAGDDEQPSRHAARAGTGKESGAGLKHVEAHTPVPDRRPAASKPPKRAWKWTKWTIRCVPKPSHATGRIDRSGEGRPTTEQDAGNESRRTESVICRLFTLLPK
ncbi:hypothetical protein WR25_18695 [Diploscapter pachys]|uniref:Uncharacterized protein n=1 Tax=Diploscapter pachys TaxID=2018661 RepID=A0A2A2JY29_9BILA|nr:hypothetical protein WR25_18695 [Diploscapter pachys]